MSYLKELFYCTYHFIKTLPSKVGNKYFSYKNPETFLLSDKQLIKQYYEDKTGCKIDLNSPMTFNEKMQWLKLHDRKPEYSLSVDKYEVKKIASEKIGTEHVLKLYGIWNTFDEIDFDSLPDTFVLKTTHDCGGYVFCKDKKILDLEAAKDKISKSLKRNYYYHSFEWPYKNVPPRILAEEYLLELNNSDDNTPNEYQFWCFNGEPKFVSVIFQPHGKNLKASYDMNWERLPFVTSQPEYMGEIEKPVYFDSMKESAIKLAENHTFVRVDFMNTKDNYYLGELTKFPASGIVSWSPKETNLKLGDMLKI